MPPARRCYDRRRQAIPSRDGVVVGYVAKPVRKAELLEAIKRVTVDASPVS
jgi:hypothetical protein